MGSGDRASSGGGKFATLPEAVTAVTPVQMENQLDPALLRPGRFDRQVQVDVPDIKGRLSVLKVHSRDKKLADDVSLEAIARRTPSSGPTTTGDRSADTSSPATIPMSYRGAAASGSRTISPSSASTTSRGRRRPIPR